MYSKYLRNSLVLKPDKSEAYMFGISRSVQSLKSITPVIVAGALIILSDHIKRLSVTINTSLTFDERSRNSCETSYIHV